MTESQFHTNNITELQALRLVLVELSEAQANYQALDHTYTVLIFFALLLLIFINSHYLFERFWR